jgi:esterase/lipase
MTTVNLDHLFASILIMIPFKKIDERDLRRRAYWAATFILNKTNVYVHKSLRADQLHLLTDDSQNRFKDFISVALEKGVVKQTGSTLVKSASKLSHAFDFHRIRIDNPVSVIANEVEPLTFLQWNLRRAAWIPDFWLKRTIVKHLKKKAAVEFEKDYNAFYMPGESKNKNVGMPFLVKGNTAKIGVVLIHGYMAAPLEVKGLADYLGRKGLWVYVPRLKGHGTSPEDLAKRTYKDWMDSVGEGYAVISNLCEHVIVGGFSTGAGLALDLAARVNDIKGVFAVCPPMRLQDFSSRFVPAVDAWNRIMERIHIDGVKKEFVENKPENPHINYLRNPVAGIREIDRLMHRVEPKLPDIQTPALVLQSRGDPVVDPKGSERVFELLGSKDKDYLLFNFDRHGILLGEGAQQVYKAILKFIRRLF